MAAKKKTKLEKDVATLKRYAKKVDAWQKKVKKWAQNVNAALKKGKNPVGGGGQNPPPPPSWPPP